jgi:mannose-6-phosphate isomerase-like protein (cupin superfamily)
MRNIDEIRDGFGVLENGKQLQTTVMVLDSGEESGPYGNEHSGSEQMLLVFEGTLEAEVDGKHFTMGTGDSTIVPSDAPHRFVNRSMERAVTFNVYAPRAY